MMQELLPLLKNMEAICPISTLSTMSKWSIFAARSVISDDKTNSELKISTLQIIILTKTQNNANSTYEQREWAASRRVLNVPG